MNSNEKTAHTVEIRVYSIDGPTHTFVLSDAELVDRALRELDPGILLTQDKITIPGDHSGAAFVPPLVTRVDLVTLELSVWDFPFVLGAPAEITREEFAAGLVDMKGDPWGLPGDASVFLDIEMVSGRHTFLCMQIVAGLPSTNLGRIYSLLKERKLIFGLREGGVGVLNLANLVRFTVRPESQKNQGPSEQQSRNFGFGLCLPADQRSAG